jgi:hypothetical protein
MHLVGCFHNYKTLSSHNHTSLRPDMIHSFPDHKKVTNSNMSGHNKVSIYLRSYDSCRPLPEPKHHNKIL